MAQMMQCGHAANSELDGFPVCVICVGLNSGATMVAEQPNLDGRQSVCPHCMESTPSRTSLPFFEHRPGTKTDTHYCGCRGWD